MVANILSVEPWTAVYLDVPLGETDYLARWPWPRAAGYHKARSCPNRQTADRRDGRTGGMCAQRQQTPVHRSCDRALRVPCRRHSPLHISGFRHWQMGKGSSVVPFTNHARRVLSSQQPTAHARMLERTPTIIFAPLRRACARAIACGGGVVPFVTSRLRCAPARRRCCAHHPPRMLNHRRVALSVACSVACWFLVMGRWRWRSDRVRRQ